MIQELVVITQKDVLNLNDPDVDELEIRDKFRNLNIRPMFSNMNSLTVERESFTLTEQENNFIDQHFYHAFIESNEIEHVRELLSNTKGVESVYIPPPGEDPVQPNYNSERSEQPNCTGNTPSFVDKQIYLGPAPYGIDAEYAWTIPGGKGERILIIDIERAWNIDHEDGASVMHGTCIYNDSNDQNNDHGTSVVGILSGPHNQKGVNGICPESGIGYVSTNLFPSSENGGIANAIDRATTCLSEGDILVIEVHRPGPRYNYENHSGQLGYIPVEWWPAEFKAIKNATSKGIIVVEAAGNGNEWLDDLLYFNPHPDFPSTWSNPFARGNMDSGAILVGAGSPPPHVNGNYGEDRTRLFSSNWGSNYGNLIDAQGWGESITTCGGGDLFFRNQNSKYTKSFGGTSGATPMVAGALACVQGILRRAGKTLLTPSTARELLRRTGSPQIENPNDVGIDVNGTPYLKRIGNRPNLRELITEALKMSP
ncbi:S8 family serine peptidase [Bacillus inaquosorum]|nr:S8 family serine peptidase [Bacillus inaquosorum]MCY9409401.1 S8 family serine peptidase [Bacillus inaquosorum]